VAHYACRTYLAVAGALPFLVRGWYSSTLNARVQAVVNKFTSRHVTPLLWAKELAEVNAVAAKQQPKGGTSENVRGGEPTVSIADSALIS
jgi:hypothetical protein